jgi:hypothetical protein
VPWLGNFGYSPIYLYVRKNDNGEIVEFKTMDAPQKVEGFLKNLKELSKIEGIE